MITWTILENYRAFGLADCVLMTADKLRHAHAAMSREQARRHARIWVRITLAHAIDRGLSLSR